MSATVGCSSRPPAKLEPSSLAPDVPQRLEPVPAELQPLIKNLALPFATDGLEGAASRASVIVDRGAVYVGTQQVSTVDALQQSGRLQRVDELFNLLKSQRENWKEAHPGQEFEGAIDYWIDENTSMLVVKDVFQTAAFAGFPNMHFMVRSRRQPLRVVALPADARVPGPPGAVERNRAVRLLAVNLRPDDSVELAWAGEGLDMQERRVPLQDLGATVKALWSSRPPTVGQPMASPQFEEAIVVVPNEAPFHKLTALLDGLNEPKLAFTGGKPDDLPAFNATVWINGPESAKALAEEYVQKSGTPSVRLGSTNVSGRLAPEVIQTTVRASFSVMRVCYEQGLARNAALTGRVNVRFAIGRDGKVTRAEAAPESTLPDPVVQRCIVHAFETLTFPPPEGGMVTVVYPVVLEPG